MKFIDKKNRLLGKIPLYILLFFIFIFFCVLVVFKIYKEKPHYVYARIKGSPGNWWWVTPRPPDWLASSIKVGDKEYNALGRPAAEILKVEIYDAGGPNKDVYLKAKLEVRKNNRTDKYRFKGEPLEIGGPIALNLNSVLFPGMVIQIWEEENESKKEFIEKTIKIRYNDKWPWEYEAIKIGEKMTDGSDMTIAETLDKEIRPAEKEALTLDGRIIKAFSPVKSDFFITLKIKVEKRGDGFVFREEQYLKVGGLIWMSFPSYNFSGAEVIAM